MKHKHAELIHAWADGAKIEMKMAVSGKWVETSCPQFYLDTEYRIKPEPKPDYRKYFVYHSNRPCIYPYTSNEMANLALIFDGETNDLKSAEVIK